MSMDYEYNFVEDVMVVDDNDNDNDDDCIIVGVTSISQKPPTETKYKKKYILGC